MRPGETAEFRNYLPNVPSNVTALAAPAPMYSPNLVAPYNTLTEAGETFSYWRYTFPGRAPTNSSTPTWASRAGASSIVLRTVTFVGESTRPRAWCAWMRPAAAPHFACLGAGASPDCCTCIGVCCDSDDQCGAA